LSTPAVPAVDADHPVTLDRILAGLVRDRWITPRQSQQLRHRLSHAPRDGEHPLVLVAEQGWQHAQEPRVRLDIERLTRWLADHAGLPYLRIDPLKVDVNAVTGVLKHSYATRFNILPVAVNEERVVVATAEPWVREWERELADVVRRRFERVVANPQTLRRYLREFYAISRSLTGAAESRAASLPESANQEQLLDLERVGEPDANDQHVVRIVDWLLQYAFDQRASDIHLEPRRERGHIRFRIDGVLHLVNEPPTPVLAAVVSRLKALGRLDVVERRRPQDGRIKSRSPGGQEVELRLSTMPTTFGEKLVMRIFDPEVLVRSFPELGFTDSDEALWRSMVAHPHGMVIVTGPTGSGKTTTLYSALKQLARPEVNICTIEDPIELVDPALNQMQVHPAIGLDFAAGVRTLLRQDPDIIMVGEIRDPETADTAVRAALTGHLVLTTLHTNDAPSTIARLLDLGLAPYLVRSALVGVVAQRLVRTLCVHCRRPARLPADQWQALVGDCALPPPKRVFEPIGCDDCRHTGYRGRTGIHEILPLGEELRALIREDVEIARIREAALRAGMRPLRLSGAEKVRAGLTTPAEVLGVVQDG
jgi:general secretion pathway protein E